jgi:membrane protease YdiL (CAAX protease family)
MAVVSKTQEAEALGSRNATITLGVIWALFVVAALLMLGVGAYGIVVPVAGLVLAVVCSRIGLFKSLAINWASWDIDKADLFVVGAFYVAVVALFKVAFGVFGTDLVAPLFIFFGLGMVIGVVGPIVYVVWIRHRPLSSIGIGFHNIRSTAALALVFGAVQFSVTLWGFQLPAPVDWIPLLLMSLTVGFFEAVFFRGFIQGTLERSIGVAPAVTAAAALYSLYHFGYGMAPSDMLFLFGLGVVYTVAYRVTANVLAIWPLLTPVGGFFSQVKSGDMAGLLPWISMLGFADLLIVFAVAIWLAARHQRRRRTPETSWKLAAAG